MSRQKYLIGNWKMNNTIAKTEQFLLNFEKQLNTSKTTVVIAPSFVSLSSASKVLKSDRVKLGAQNIAWEDSGAFTGEISGEMLKECKVTFCIVGHSERRQYFGESDETVNKRIKACLRQGINPVLCVGETLYERQHNMTNQTIKRQLQGAFDSIASQQAEKCIVAYEPVWAIGTGMSANEAQAGQVAGQIRDCLSVLYPSLYGQEIGQKICILYGGSANTKNASLFLNCADIDGLLVGGASLFVDDFLQLAHICESV
ncbi:MAG: triose-phosphate isomerase [Clostridiales bacterium]|nr:triose-phosphate isomerase [Clostridiales bacterium]